jgi:hypothetical protein
LYYIFSAGRVVLGIGKGRGREVGGVCERKRKIGPF